MSTRHARVSGGLTLVHAGAGGSGGREVQQRGRPPAHPRTPPHTRPPPRPRLLARSYFYATLYLGTPPRKFAVIVDTGSTMTYVPCSSCGKGCGPNHQDAAFDPHASSTSLLIPCASPKCACGSPTCGCAGGQCTYTRSYAEKSSSSGAGSGVWRAVGVAHAVGAARAVVVLLLLPRGGALPPPPHHARSLRPRAPPPP